MLRRIDVRPGETPVIERPALRAAGDVEATVRDIVGRVRAGGDAALAELGRRFDGVALERFEVSPAELRAARAAVDAGARADIGRALDNIRAFHTTELEGGVRGELRVETSPGVSCERRVVPIERIGAYVPGGRAPLVSTLLMLGVPAALAGCELRVVCTPPRRDGSLDPHLLLAAELCGFHRVFKLGGAQAVAAMAYGTASVPKVDKLFGPGNAWVTAAKELVGADPAGAARDLPAGPSEVMVVADETADPGFVAADLLSQAEHGPDSQVVLVTTSATLGAAVATELEQRLADLPRAAVAREALAGSYLALVADLEQALRVANAYAPEHLILQVEEPRTWVARVRNAGAVFLGPWTPEAVGDYASGANHVLPTYGHARAHGGLSVAAFQKTITVQELEPRGLLDLGPVVERLSALEGLDAHGRAVSVRLQRLRAGGPPRGRPAGRARGGVRHLARPEILELEPYVSARSLAGDGDHEVYLDANESAEAAASGLHRYPAPQPAELRDAASALFGAAPDELLMLRGADEAIDLLLRAFCRAGRDRVVVTPPTYGMYGISARIQGALVVEAPLRAAADGWSLDRGALLDACDACGEELRLVFLCSPNNPTGQALDPEAVRELCRALAGRAVVVLDEAYVEFSAHPSLAGSAGAIANLVVLRTLSKAWGAAGARFGLAFAAAPTIALLNRVRAPYPLSTPSIAAAARLLTPAGRARMERGVARVRERREHLAAALRELALVEHVYPSEANFVLVRASDAETFLARCAARRIAVRDRSGVPGLGGCVRVSVGSEAENTALVAALARERVGDGRGEVAAR